MELKIDPDFARRVPGYRIIVAECGVTNTDTSEEQQQDAQELIDDISYLYDIDDINKIPGIAATRAGYKACGKDPNRYRPAQEQLLRRIVSGRGIYVVNALVDAGNMLSMLLARAIGCFDADKIEGDTIELGIGRAGEPYCGIGRGELNIEGLPVLRDAAGAFGTPTSDSERTKIGLDTRRLLLTIHLFDPDADADHIIELAQRSFSTYCSATDFVARVYSVD